MEWRVAPGQQQAVKRPAFRQQGASERGASVECLSSANYGQSKSEHLWQWTLPSSHLARRLPDLRMSAFPDDAIIATPCQPLPCVNRARIFAADGDNGYMDLGTLKRLMADNKETQAGIARMLGISPDKMSKVLSGKRRLTAEEANKLASYFGTASNSGELPLLLPIVGLVSAGAWREGFQEVRGYMPSPDRALSRDAFVVIVEGDSMNLVAQDGEGIIVDPRDLDLVSGKYYVIRNAEGETTFKRYVDNPARLEPCSSNPEHQAIFPGRDGFTVVGRARKRVSDL
jgi:repressor LexA